MHSPQLVILDEPVNGLDPQGIADMRNLILHLSRHLNKTIVISSHLLSEIEQIATRMLIIDKGKKVVEGSVEELLDPAKTIVEIKTTNMEGAMAFIRGSTWNPFFNEVVSGIISMSMHQNDIPRLNHDLVLAGIGVISLQAKNSLEDYFLNITAGRQYVGAFAN